MTRFGLGSTSLQPRDKSTCKPHILEFLHVEEEIRSSSFFGFTLDGGTFAGDANIWRRDARAHVSGQQTRQRVNVRKRALILLMTGTKFEGTGHFDSVGRASIRCASMAAV